MKTKELNDMRLSPLSDDELQRVRGGYTSFVYDLATALRAHFQAITGQYGELAKTAAIWFAQQ